MELTKQDIDDPINYKPLEDMTNNEEEPQHDQYLSLLWGCPKQFKLSFVVILCIFIGVYFVTTFFISNIVLLPMQVDGSSMYPTLNYEYQTSGNSYAQDVVYLWKTQNVEYGDIVVFNALNYTQSSTKTQLYYIKRVIATAGDTLQFKRVGEISSDYMCSYVLYKNGELLNEPYIESTMIYNILSEKYDHIINEEILVIPEGFVFLMGDNRNNSKDSREFGFVNIKDIVGKVKVHIPYGKTFIFGIFTSIKKGYLF